MTAETASRMGMPAATSAPNTTSSRTSVSGTEVASAWRKFSELSMVRAMLASPVSATIRPGWAACTAATARWSAATAWSELGTLPGTSNVTRALRPFADTSDGRPGCPAPAASGDWIPVADFGRAVRAVTTSRTACRMLVSAANVRPAARAWIRTTSLAAP